MAAGHVAVAPDSSGKDVDAQSIVSTETGTPTVYRQTITIGDQATYANVATVTSAGALTVANPTLSTLFDYATRVDGNPVYIGQAAPGTAQSATTWGLKQLTYDAQGRAVSILNATGAWSGRTGLTYT